MILSVLYGVTKPIGAKINKADEKLDKITLVLGLLGSFFIEDAVITIDAMNYQKAIAENLVNNQKLTARRVFH